MKVFTTLRSLLKKRVSVALVTLVDGERKELLGKKLLFGRGRVYCSQLEASLSDMVASKDNILLSRTPALLENIGGHGLKFFIHPHLPAPRLIILGGGHIGAALSRMAAFLNFEIIVIDDRPFFSSRERHPHANQLICGDFGRVLENFSFRSSDFIVIVTRGHRHDRLCLERVLGKGTAYLGMMGSRHRVHALVKELQEKGYAGEELKRLHAPIGLDIGAETEEEIALSILAEVTMVRKKGCYFFANQEEVLRELEILEEKGGQAVLATIIKSRGSTPRREGSRLLVFPDGRLTGTIGGGCLEADVRREALLLRGEGFPKILRINLNSERAAEDGMACGGKMELFLEPLSFPIP